MSTTPTPFITGSWSTSLDVRDFIRKNITPYDGDASFLQSPTERTQRIWQQCQKLLQQEHHNNGILAIDTDTISTITSHKPGYIDKNSELIVGLQTDMPLKRAIKPFGGIRVVEKACQEKGVPLDDRVQHIFTHYRKTHSDGVFDAYTKQMRLYRKSGVITGLPDAYARGRIIGDYRRVALYGIDQLIEYKLSDLEKITGSMNDEKIRLREEVSEQTKALTEIKTMASMYGFDISQPATNAREAIQWTYFGFLASLKEHDGAAMSLGNVNTFFDIYLERDIHDGTLTEQHAQELIDDFVIKLRLVRHLRTQEYDELFSGDPTWLTESLTGVWQDGTHKVTKTAYRFLQTLYNLGPSPEPNLTVLWSEQLPETFKQFCAQVSLDTSSIQYENDDLMRSVSKVDDYAISCCVSQLEVGKQMQFFGARCNLAKTLLLALNQGRDEMQGYQLVANIPPLSSDLLNYDEVIVRFKQALSQVVETYVNTMNIIHYMHDKYYYERSQMALHDTDVKRVMAFGIAGLSVVADSLSAIKYGKVTAHRSNQGLTTAFTNKRAYPHYGNDDNRVDSIAQWLVTTFYQELQKHQLYRQATPTLSVLTITSNVVYGSKTGATPDGRKAGQPFAPGANPVHGRDTHGAIASLNSVAKLPYESARDGISNTFSIVPRALGADLNEQKNNLVDLLDGYFMQNAHHLNVNVLDKSLLEHAMAHPELYPQLTIRVSGYAVHFTRLTRQQQEEVIARTFFNHI
jgi:formate C-acetyltransferase